MSLTVSPEPWIRHPWFLPCGQGQHSVEAWPKRSRIRITRGNQSDILPELLTLIESAQKRVFCCSFLLGSEALRRALVNAAHRLKGHVYVLTALDEKKLAAGLAAEIDTDQLDRTRLAFQPLTHGGVYARGVSDVHAKFCVVDDEAAVLGSPNFDGNGLADHGGQGSGEVALSVTGERAGHLATLFRHLWCHSAEIEAQPSPVAYHLASIARSIAKPPAHPPPVQGMPFWTFQENQGVLDHLRYTVQRARRTLFLAAYSLRDLDSGEAKALADDIVAATERGVIVQLYLRSQTRNLPHLRRLVAAGIQVRADRLNHAKWAIADEREASIFSANFDGQHGLTSGCETGVRLLPGPETNELVELHKAWWVNCEVEAWAPPNVNAIAERTGLQLGSPDGSREIALTGPMAPEVIEMLRHPTVVLRRSGGDDKFYLLASLDAAVEICRQEKMWDCQRVLERHLRPPTVAQILASGVPGGFDGGWIPVGVEFHGP